MKDLPPTTKYRNPLYIILAIGAVFIVLQYWNPLQPAQEIPYSQFLIELSQGRIEHVRLSETKISGTFKDGEQGKAISFTTIPVRDDQLVEKLTKLQVPFEGAHPNTFWVSIFPWLIWVVILLVIWRFMLTRLTSGPPGGLMRLGKSKAKIYVERGVKTSFDDIAGEDEAKAEVIELIDFLKNPVNYARLGARTPKGILLVGPPGCGKTLMARAMAGEANVPFFSINGSEFVEMFVGLGAARVRDLFEEARKNAPCIIFIDELDAIGKSRSLGYAGSGAHEETEQTLNQLLAELDGFDPSQGIILLAATNRPEILDPALLRAGRFDRQILLDNPDRAGRKAILEVHMKKITVADDIEADKIASLTPGFSGADLANLVNEAALLATRRNAKQVTEEDFIMAIERIIAGLERKKRLMNAQERRRVAYHEMGHATVSLAAGKMEQVQKVSIIPRGIGALGYTMQRPIEDRYLMSRDELLTKMAILLGGRASETLFFDDVSTGASDDLVKATNIARAMVTEYGMSDKLGLATFEEPRSPFLQGPLIFPKQPIASEQTAQIIDSEVKDLLAAAFNKATETIKKNSTFIEAAAQRLLEIETLDHQEIDQLWQQLKAVEPSPVKPVAAPH